MNTPVNFELAKLLKQRGFNEKVRGRIHVSHWHLVKDNIIPSNVNTYHTDMFAPLDNWNDGKQHFMSMPTISEVVMWLYKKHGIWIWVERYSIMFRPYTEELGDERFGKWEGYKYSTPTEAYEAAIEYTLKNLI